MAERIGKIFDKMRQAASPCPQGLPIRVWRALPEEWRSAVARTLMLVEQERRRPEEWLQAYITMVPKAAGGDRPRDQRPMTVLEVLYRVWVKGVTMEWKVTVHAKYLGPAAMGFRTGASALEVPQLLQDVLQLQRSKGGELWLASFDVQKCYDSIPC